MRTTKVLVALFIVALLPLWITGCGYRRTTIVLPDENGRRVELGAERDGEPVVVRGRAIIVETYGAFSESAIDAGNAADRQQLIAFCTTSMEHAKLEMCKTVGADRAPSDSPKALYNKHIPVSVTRQRYNQEYFPGVWWYGGRRE